MNARLRSVTLLVAFAISTVLLAGAVRGEEIAFPQQRPRDGNFNRPVDGSAIDISPPGFCWWRAGPRDAMQYRLTVRDATGRVVYQSPLVADPVHVPPIAFSPGEYAWIVDAVADGQISATLGPRHFTIVNDAAELPWVPAAELLQKVPAAHPRLLFPAAERDAYRRTLNTTRRKAYVELRAVAERALDLELMPKPTFDRFDRETEYAQRRVAYRDSYHQFSRTYHHGMLPLAAVYVLSGERRYGEAAKAHLLNLLDWEVDGIASLELSFDEIGLRIQRTAAQAYDWLYDLLTPDERDAVKQMLIAHGNAMLARLERRDFLNYSAYSHDGRLPGYLVEFSIALAEEPVAEEWLDYALRTLLTVFPHWAGADGGWAEGINYSLSYNDRFITPLQSLYVSTGYDLFKKPFFRKFRKFAMYNVSPCGEVLPFGDGEQKHVSARADELYSILFFHALRYQDPVTRWWIEMLERDGAQPDRLGVLHRLLLPDNLSPRPPEEMPLDAAFYGVGWAALHTDLTQPMSDLIVMFKSSPFGSVSHSHADQNSFVVLKGGRALAIPGGMRFPQHGSPFHEQYTQQTMAHNALLIDGQGQRNRDGTAAGKLVAFHSSQHFAYVAGDASQCYPQPLKKNLRHMLLVRPSMLVVLDEVEAAEPMELAWLMHTFEKPTLRSENQTFTVARGGERMQVILASSSSGLALSLTDEWPIAPKAGYEMVTAPDPPRQWHFQAATTEANERHVLAAVMLIGDEQQMPQHTVSETDGGLTIESEHPAGQAVVRIELGPPASSAGRLLRVRIERANGETDAFSIPKK